MADVDLQQAACAKAGITGRLMSTPVTAEIITAISQKPATVIVKHGHHDRGRGAAGRAAPGASTPKTIWRSRTITLARTSAQIGEMAERCMAPLGVQGAADPSSNAGTGRFMLTRSRGGLCVLEWALRTGRRAAACSWHPARVPIGHEQQMDRHVQARARTGPAGRSTTAMAPPARMICCPACH